MKYSLRMAACLAAALTVAARAGDKCGNCPVSGEAAKKEHAEDYKGKKVYFCCDGCPAAFKAEPAKFAAKTNFQLFKTGQIVQVGCPFSGGKLNKDTETEFEGVKLSFCCKNCKGKFDKSDKKMELAFAKTKGYTFQDKCPVSGKPIKADQMVEHDGKKVYFCCGGCPAAFKANPEKFSSKLPKD